jgi:predicted dehydrogenase
MKSVGGISTCAVVVLGAAHIHMTDLVRVVRSRPAVRVVAVCDHDLGRAARWALALDANAGADIDAALDARALRGALVYGETSRHQALVSAAARRGLAVFVEKPLAVSQTDVMAISEVLAGGGLFSTGFFLRYADAFRRLRDIVASGNLGKIRHAAVSLVHGGLAQGWFDGEYAWMREPTEGGGGFFDLVVHCLDLAAWVLGPIEHVVNVRVHVSGHHGSAVVRTQSGTVVDLEAGWEAAAPALQMSVTGATTTLTASGSRLLAGSTVVASGRPPDAGDAPRAWLDALAHLSDQPLVGLADAIDRMRAIDLLRYRVSSGPLDGWPT